jgi:hypothetical protein
MGFSVTEMKMNRNSTGTSRKVLLRYNRVSPVPLTVFDIKGIPATQGERIGAAVEAGGNHLRDSYEAWITSDPFGRGVRVAITGPLGFERRVEFALDEDSFEITEQVRVALDE